MFQLIVGNVITLQRSDNGWSDKTLQFRRIRYGHMQGLERLLDTGENARRGIGKRAVQIKQNDLLRCG